MTDLEPVPHRSSPSLQHTDGGDDTDRREVLWRRLNDQCLPELLPHLPHDAALRVWVAGCATGEDAYVLAMAAAERLGRRDALTRLRVYATDIDDLALDQARRGRFPAGALDAVPPAVRDRYLEATDGEMSFDPELRRRMIFGRHDVLHNAPISRIDLLFCRKVLTSFPPETQARLANRFHFALAEHGLLVLDRSQTSFGPAELFRSRSAGIFTKQPAPAPERQAPKFSDAEAARLQEQLDHTDQELRAAYRELKSSNEELETASDELHATVEELHTTNEELLSTNQTIEVMNQELTATNDELTAINGELRRRTAEIDRVGAVLAAVLDLTRDAVVVIDQNLHIEAWNAPAAELWGVASGDGLGRPIATLGLGLPVEELSRRLTALVTGDDDRPFEVRISDHRSRELTCRVRGTPLRDAEGRVGGAVLTLEPVDGDGRRSAGQRTAK